MKAVDYLNRFDIEEKVEEAKYDADNQVSDVMSVKVGKEEWPYFERGSLSAKTKVVAIMRVLSSSGKEVAKNILDPSPNKLKKKAKEYAGSGFTPDPAWVKKLGKKPANEELSEGINPVDVKNAKDINKKVPKEIATFTKGWDKMWTEKRAVQQAWSDSHWTMKYTIQNMINTIEDIQQGDVEMSDEMWHTMVRVKEELDSIASMQSWGGVAPMGAVKRRWKSLKQDLDKIADFAKNFK